MRIVVKCLPRNFPILALSTMLTLASLILLAAGIQAFPLFPSGGQQQQTPLGQLSALEEHLSEVPAGETRAPH